MPFFFHLKPGSQAQGPARKEPPNHPPLLVIGVQRGSGWEKPLVIGQGAVLSLSAGNWVLLGRGWGPRELWGFSSQVCAAFRHTKGVPELSFRKFRGGSGCRHPVCSLSPAPQRELLLGQVTGPVGSSGSLSHFLRSWGAQMLGTGSAWEPSATSGVLPPLQARPGASTQLQAPPAGAEAGPCGVWHMSPSWAGHFQQERPGRVSSTGRELSRTPEDGSLFL